MIAVFIGKGVTSAFRQTVLKILGEKISVFEISCEQIKKPETKPAITLIFKSDVNSISLPNSAVFLNQNKTASISGERYLILNSSNPADIACAKNSGGEVITLGLSLRDSVTFSSLTHENCVISIQRSITRFDGEKIEPCEIPCKISANDDKYAVLCANLLLLLSGHK